MRKSNPPTNPLSFKSPVAIQTTDNVIKDAITLHDIAFAKLLILFAMKVFTHNYLKSGGIMVAWFAKYGFPIAAIYNVKPKGGNIAGGCASVELVKTAKNVWTKKREKKEEQRQKEAQESMIAYAEECRRMMY